LCCYYVFFLTFPVYADTSSVNGGINSGGGGVGGNRTSYGQGTELFIKAVIDFTEGDISYEQFTNRTSEIVGDYMSEYTDRAGLAFMSEISGKISETVAKYGLDAPAYVSEWIYDIIDDFTETEEVSTTDKNGYSTMISITNQYGMIQQFSWNGYIVVYPQDDGTIEYYCCWADCERHYYYYNAGYEETKTSTASYNATYKSSDYNISVYGDVRYEDGSPAPTDDETATVTKINLDELSDTELEELLEDILEELERQNPDLSNIEGLLEAIYYRLGSLDSDNDNELLSQVLVAIQSLEMNGDNSELLAILKEIRDSLSDDNGSEDDSEEPLDNLTYFQEQILKYISPGDITEYEEFAINVRGLFYSKFSFIYEFQAFFSSLSWGSPDSIVIDFSFMENSYSIDTSIYNELMPTVRGMLAFFVYGVFCIRCYKRLPTIISGGGDE